MPRASMSRLTARACLSGAVAASLADVIGGSDLAAARALVPPAVHQTSNGEFEGYAFWDEHDELLSRAWRELGPRRQTLYEYGPQFEQLYIHKDLRRAADAARAGSGEALARGLFHEALPGVFASKQLFTPQFLQDMLNELEHIENSGIPTRRPNGMNRYGLILDHVGMESALRGVIQAYIRPLAAMLFPELVGIEDADEHYAFTVRYEHGGDVELAKHGDASVVTLNLCLGHSGWQGGELRFFDYESTGLYALPANASAGAGDLVFEPGMVVVHRGQHKHQALQLRAGTRTNAIIWLMGRNDVVRVAPYKVEEYLSAHQRWHWPEQSHVSSSMLHFKQQDL